MAENITSTIQGPLTVGNVTEKRGELVRGALPLISLPTGNDITIPVVIASGVHDGPTFLLTANIHGDELVGVLVVHRFLEGLDLSTLRGRVVAFPSLNPTGHLVATRFPFFEAKDPNRCWPEYRPKTPGALRREQEGLGGYEQNDPWIKYQKAKDDEPGPQERAFAPLAKLFASLNAKFHIDLHTFSIVSTPFAFVDRVLYSEATPNALESAQKLFDTTKSMVESLGLTWVMEQPARQYVKNKLHRSTSGYTLNALRIPSCTLELGPMHAVPNGCKEAGLTAVRNALRWAGMIDGSFETVTTVPVVKVSEPHRYLVYPSAPVTGIVDHHISVGDTFKKGDVLCTIRAMDGRVLAKVEAEMDGFLIAWYNGIAKYEGNSLGFVGVRDAPVKVCMAWEELAQIELEEASIH